MQLIEEIHSLADSTHNITDKINQQKGLTSNLAYLSIAERLVAEATTNLEQAARYLADADR